MAIGGPSKIIEGKKTFQTSSYLEKFYDFSQELDTLKELNKELPRLIKKSFLTKMTRNVKELKKNEKEWKEFEVLETTIFGIMTDLRNKKPDIKPPETLDVSPKATNLYFESLVAASHSRKYVEFIRIMSLEFLVVEMEAFLQKILTVTYNRKPETLSSSQKNITYEDLVKFSSLDEVRNEMIEDTLLSLFMKKDIEEWNNYFKQKFGIELAAMTD
jgi:hypothetical protein